MELASISGLEREKERQ